MIALLGRRLAAAVLLLFVVLSLVFFLLHLAPGDPASVLLDPRAPAEERQRQLRQWGLDRPLGSQYLHWLASVALRGDWGSSLLYRRPAAEVLAEALPRTLLLGGTALLVQLLLALTLGVAAARRPGSGLDRAVRLGSITLYSVPTFWLGLMAALLFAHRWPIFPPGHLHSVGAADWGPAARALDLLHHLALPALVLGASGAGAFVRLLQTQLVTVLGRQHFRAARSRGLGERRILWVHGLRNALGPLIQLVGLSLPVLLSGALVTEVVFAWPGLGRVTFTALLARDYPLVLASTAWSGLLVVSGSLFADLAHAAVDPRVRPDG